MKWKLIASFRAVICSLFAVAMAAPAWAASYDLPKSTGAFAKLGTWLQDYVDFMTGTGAVAAIVISLIIFVLIWAYAPKSGAMGGVLRTVAAAIVVLNIGTWMASFV